MNIIKEYFYEKDGKGPYGSTSIIHQYIALASDGHLYWITKELLHDGTTRTLYQINPYSICEKSYPDDGYHNILVPIVINEHIPCDECRKRSCNDITPEIIICETVDNYL